MRLGRRPASLPSHPRPRRAEAAQAPRLHAVYTPRKCRLTGERPSCQSRRIAVVVEVERGAMATSRGARGTLRATDRKMM